EYVEAMWLMLQQDSPDDFAIGTGESHSVREFCQLAFKEAGIQLEWRGSGIEEVGVVASSAESLPPRLGDVVIAIDPRYFRPTEVEFLLADISKARKEIGWEPKVTFEKLVQIMVSADIKALEELRQCQDVIRQIMNKNNKL
ncbi:MAG: GDP-mannose 4,6-dehydratase, partial [Desulfobacteraceae bacterium]|nr:GDP-mannose 4,6-dehydratase [Desulfobacteraceae bacterium]